MYMVGVENAIISMANFCVLDDIMATVRFYIESHASDKNKFWINLG